MTRTRSEAGFTLIELIVAVGVLLIVSSIVTNALMQMTNAQMTIWNRTEMHSGIRGATELLQQEVGQAGRLSLPEKVTLAGNVAAAATCDPEFPDINAVTVGLSSASGDPTKGMWANVGPPASYILLTTMDGDSQETFKVASIDASADTIRACFTKAHVNGTVVMPMGAFATGIIPDTGIINASTANVLKMFGNINGDGRMVYVEYTCDYVSGNLYRKVMDFDAAPPSPVPGPSEILLGNIVQNPGSPPAPCFTYQTTTMTVQGTPFTFVLDVAITLTVQTQQMDPITKEYQKETKALLNVSPRNVFNAWSLASIGYTDRIQSTPASITALLP
jgi:prepilin-type N-terminal cleavage/methylation domain-containing protein